MNELWKKFFLRTLLFFAYALVGAWILTLIEAQDDTNATIAKRMLDSLRKKMSFRYNITNKTEFDEFVTEASEAIALMGKKDWSFLNACGFTLAAMTTIGYGDIVPQTNGGKGFVIPFSLIGIPLVMVALKSGGELISLGVRTTYVAFSKRVLGHESCQRLLPRCLAIAFSMVTIFICIMGGVQTYLDEWTFLESVYCWFVTCSTMGFGDYVPLQNYAKTIGNSTGRLVFSGIMLTLPYILGLCLVSSLVNVMVEFSEYELAHAKSQVRRLCGCYQCGSHMHGLDREGSVEHDNNNVDVQLQNFSKKDAA
ncbi:potassium channel subfamily K member 3 isoform X2 [Nematostella vectensis]|nr:potassium channel subfamily K member 3 isoform X2 [Nematostella vectensis]XP_048586330.1 potassium channel subfamily K member 3 isoform X2 [Nematostella vectensis]